MKKTLKWVGIIVSIPFLLFIISAILLYLPPVQNWAVKQVASYASESTGMNISVDHVNLEFPLDLGVEGVKVIQQNDSLPQVKDTVADIEKMVVDVELLPLFSSQVMIDQLDFHRMKVNTTNFIHEARIKGRVAHLSLQSHGIDLGKEHVRVDHALLDDALLSVELSDTVPPDTTPSKNFWKIDIDNLKLKKTDFTLHMPGDTLNVHAYMGDAVAQKGYLDLFKGLYSVGKLDLKESKVNYDNRYEVHTKGLDFNHLALDSLTLLADSFYYCDTRLDIKVRKCSFREQSGLKINELTGPFAMDSTKLWLPNLWLRTPVSTLRASVDMDMNAFADKEPGKLMATLHGSFGKSDLMMFMGAAPLAMRQKWPNYPLSVDGSLKGNMKYLKFSGLTVNLPTALRFHADGWMANLTDMDRLKGNIDLHAKTYHLGFVTAMLDKNLMKTINVPSGIGVDGNFKLDGQVYTADFTATQGGGNLKAKGKVNVKQMAYQAKLAANRFPLQNFVPRMGLHPFTGDAEVDGVGTDVLSPKTRLNAKARVVKFNYDKYNLDHINAVAQIANGKVHANVDSRNELLKGKFSVDALTNTKNIRATLVSDLDKADLYHLHFTDTPFSISFCGHVDVATDLKDNYKVQGLLCDLIVSDKDSIYRPDDVVIDLLTRRDTTHAVLDCADFHLNMDAETGYKSLMTLGQGLANEVQKQIRMREIDQAAIRQSLPNARLFLNTGKYNFIASILERYGIAYKNANIDMASSRVSGLNGTMSIDSLVYLPNDLRIDSIYLDFNSTHDEIAYQGYVRNNPDNNPVFKAIFEGDVKNNGTEVLLNLYDKNDELGLRLPLEARMEHQGIRMGIKGDDPILGYKTFHVNDNNYVLLNDSGRISADLKLTADDGQGIQVYTDDDHVDAMQDITFSLNKFDLQKVLSVIPYAPKVSGIMDGDFHAVQTNKSLTVSSDVNVKNLVYEGSKMGDVGSEFVYMPLHDGSHQVSGILMSNGNQVATIEGTYRSEGAGYLDAQLEMERTPLNFINGFIPDQIVGLRGFGEGTLSVKGPLNKPDVEGEIYLDSSYLVSVPYGVEMRFADDPVRIVGSHLLFENFEMFANNDQPLNVSGYYDFSDLDNMMMDIRMRATNFQIIDAKENPRSEAFGKAFVNFYGTMTGPVSALNMRGKLDVLGSTDMTYVLKESELTTDNQLNELVKFTDFKDSVTHYVEKPKPEGFNMQMAISVDESAHILCALNADHSNYIDLMGGGDLRLGYSPATDLQLTGRYTLNNGEMKYSLPVIPLKTFNIQDGSYLEFTGDAYNPILSITATENVKASVNSGGDNGRQVDFVCGVKLSKTLQSPGIQFIISAPNDGQLQGELNTMSAEEQSKIAIAMLASGMYLADGNTNAFTMNSALSTFLNSEINNIAGSAMRSMGLDLGMTVDNQTTATGSLHTDYNFKFAKRFWNNRLSLIVGGQVSSGASVQQERGGSNNSFFNNVEMQYRLDDRSSKYLRLFYNNNSFDWLEGRVGEYGGGFMWKRKLRHFKDILRFNIQDEETIPAMAPDTTKKDTVKKTSVRKTTVTKK